MSWKKLGRVFVPTGEQEWMRSHASNPTVVPIADNLYRIYFSTRDSKSRSSVGALTLDMSNPLAPMGVSESPLLAPGRIGTFDDSGISMGSIVVSENKQYLFYTGWNLSVTVPFRNSIGLAISEDAGASFQKYSEAPILDRSRFDLFSLSYPFVMRDSNLWHMWYGSNLNWGDSGKDMNHVIKYATSVDGIHWNTNEKVCLGSKEPTENAFCRPSVIKDNGIYRMWYSVRGTSYRIGYAESENGQDWLRKDQECDLVPSLEGWDSESVEYCQVFKYKNDLYMLYCGNGYGQTGFGIAVEV